MVNVKIDLTKINNWEALHREFATVMGFPEFYGNNMNAWEDCMSDLSRPDTAGMTDVIVPEGENLVITLLGSAEFRLNHYDKFSALLNSITNVNRMKMSIAGSSQLLLLLL